MVGAEGKAGSVPGLGGHRKGAPRGSGGRLWGGSTTQESAAWASRGLAVPDAVGSLRSSPLLLPRPLLPPPPRASPPPQAPPLPPRAAAAGRGREGGARGGGGSGPPRGSRAGAEIPARPGRNPRWERTGDREPRREGPREGPREDAEDGPRPGPRARGRLEAHGAPAGSKARSVPAPRPGPSSPNPQPAPCARLLSRRSASSETAPLCVPQVSLVLAQSRSLFIPQVPSESELESVLGRLGGARGEHS